MMGKVVVALQGLKKPTDDHRVIAER